MCGIVYAHDFSGAPVNNGILQQFDSQRHRGTQGFGLFDGSHLHIKREADEDKILKWLVKYDSNLILFHHRFPTSTANVKQAAHPFATKEFFGDNQYILVHNGIISNSHDLIEEHEALGIKYQSELTDGTFNDSESLLWDVALHLEGKQDKLQSRGQIAFVCVKLTKGKLNKMYFARNVNPLNMYRDKKGIALSSEGPGEAITSHELYTWNYDLRRLTHKPLDIPQYKSYVDSYYSTPHYKGEWEDEYDWKPGRVWDSDAQKYVDEIKPTNIIGAAGDWLPKHLQDRWGKHLSAKGYKRDPVTQLLLPEVDEIDDDDDLGQYSVGPGYITRDDYDADEEFVYTPSYPDIEGKAWEYLNLNDGIFELAYRECEEEYEQIMIDAHATEQFREARLLESVMEHFSNDPEYVNETSTSSLWEAIWDQASLQAKKN